MSILTVNTRAEAISTSISVATDYVEVYAYDVGLPSVKITYKRDSVIAAGGFQSVDGAVWNIINPDVYLEMFGATGNGGSDDQAAWASAKSLGRPIVLADGRSYLVTDATNANGVPVLGFGKLLTAVSGGLRQRSTYADKGFAIGQEYLARAYQFIALTQGGSVGTLNIDLFGDSTIQGGYGEAPLMVDTVLRGLFADRGIPNVSIANRGVSGTKWSDLNALPHLSATKGLIIIKYGINDAPYGLAAMFADARAKLAAIRADANGGLGNLSVILVGPNSTSDSPNGRDERWYESIREGYVQLARDFDCAYFDSYAYLRDSRKAAGAWMDNPYGDGRAVHPLGNMNSWLWSGVMDAFFSRSALAPWSTNRVQNVGDNATTPSATLQPSGYQSYISTYRALTGQGWPINGVVTTTRHLGGTTLQVLSGEQNGDLRVKWRWSILATDSWSSWSGTVTALPLLNGWVSEGTVQPPVYWRNVDGEVSLDGAMKNGTTVTGTVIATLPSGYRPAQDIICNATLYSTTQQCVVRIKPNGDVVGEQGLDAGFVSLSGIRFMAA